jgi:hypothetical protein
VGTIYDPRELPGVSTVGPGIGRGVTTCTQILDDIFVSNACAQKIGWLHKYRIAQTTMQLGSLEPIYDIY